MDTKPSGLVSMYSLSRQTFGRCDSLCGSLFVGLDTSARALHGAISLHFKLLACAIAPATPFYTPPPRLTSARL